MAIDWEARTGTQPGHAVGKKNLSGLFVNGVLLTVPAILLVLEPVRVFRLVFRRRIVTPLAFTAGKRDTDPNHRTPLRQEIPR
jgi:hypothetical protein